MTLAVTLPAEFWPIVLTACVILLAMMTVARALAFLVRPGLTTQLKDRQWLWRAWAGLILLSLTTATWTAYAATSSPISSTWEAVIICLFTTYPFGLLICEITRFSLPGRTTSEGRRIAVASCGALLLIGWALLAVLLIPRDRITGYAAVSVSTAFGLFYFGIIGLGTRLRVRLRVVGSDGKEDPASAAYAIQRIEAMGQLSPRGMAAPAGADILWLPAEAVSALPNVESKLVSSLMRLLQMAALITPWTAEVALVGDGVATAHLRRNGSQADSTMIFADGLGGKLANEDERAVCHKLLTAAAAFVLIRLSDRHLVLKEGLCGTSKWRSLACQVLAGTPPMARRHQGGPTTLRYGA